MIARDTSRQREAVHHGKIIPDPAQRGTREQATVTTCTLNGQRARVSGIGCEVATVHVIGAPHVRADYAWPYVLYVLGYEGAAFTA